MVKQCSNPLRGSLNPLKVTFEISPYAVAPNIVLEHLHYACQNVANSLYNETSQGKRIL